MTKIWPAEEPDYPEIDEEEAPRLGGLLEFIRNSEQPASTLTYDEFDRFVNSVMRYNPPRNQIPLRQVQISNPRAQGRSAFYDAYRRYQDILDRTQGVRVADYAQTERIGRLPEGSWRVEAGQIIRNDQTGEVWGPQITS